MSPGRSVTVLVNSTDSYADCWEPFFALFAAYWPDCPYEIVLNTEAGSYRHPTLSIRCSRVGTGEGGRRLTWSESLGRCLDSIDSEVVLYLQEDYFLNGLVDGATIERFVEIMTTEGYAHIRLMEVGGSEPYEPSPTYAELWRLPRKANYLVGLQAGLWRREVLRSYLRPKENAWQFERWGTLRAHRGRDRFYCQNLDLFNRRGRFIVPYTPTGIVRGRWYEPAVRELFAEHGIVVDFSKRGFYRTGIRDRLVRRVRSRVRRIVMRYAP